MVIRTGERKTTTSPEIRDTDKLEAYLHLNGLCTIDVPGDHYCGFHAANALLRICNGTDLDELRKTIVDRVLAYVNGDGKNTYAVTTYLDDFGFDAPQRPESSKNDLSATLLEKNRWLTLSDMSIIFLAYGKKVEFILETTYPVYQKDTLYINHRADHYTPVVARV